MCTLRDACTGTCTCGMSHAHVHVACACALTAPPPPPTSTSPTTSTSPQERRALQGLLHAFGQPQQGHVPRLLRLEAPPRERMLLPWHDPHRRAARREIDAHCPVAPQHPVLPQCPVAPPRAAPPALQLGVPLLPCLCCHASAAMPLLQKRRAPAEERPRLRRRGGYLADPPGPRHLTSLSPRYLPLSPAISPPLQVSSNPMEQIDQTSNDLVKEMPSLKVCIYIYIALSQGERPTPDPDPDPIPTPHPHP